MLPLVLFLCFTNRRMTSKQKINNKNTVFGWVHVLHVHEGWRKTKRFEERGTSEQRQPGRSAVMRTLPVRVLSAR